jgi:hypothetical protein
MFHACVQRFDVTGNLLFFFKILLDLDPSTFYLLLDDDAPTKAIQCTLYTAP